jgi:adenylylsulfate kinase
LNYIPEHIHPITSKVNQTDRAKMLNQSPKLIWFTGLSGSGKSTIAIEIEKKLFEMGFKTYLLDGDNIRSGLNSNLGFTEEDRIENIRRIGEVSHLMLDAGLIVLASFIAPFQADREMVKHKIKPENYIEVYVNCPLEICEKRDVKGLYAKARKGEIKHFTGIDAPYEPPKNPDVIVETDKETIEESLKKILKVVMNKIKSK